MRILFLIIVGPVVFGAMATAIYFSPNQWMFGADWSSGRPVVTMHNVPGGGR